MIAYIDSSFLLSILLEDSRYDNAFSLWQKADVRFSSRLLEIETYIGLIRYKGFAGKTSDWLKVKTLQNSMALDEIVIHSVDSKISLLVQSHPIITNCKSLDAIHLATALLFQKNYSSKMNVFSYDKNLNKNAEAMGFEIIA